MKSGLFSGYTRRHDKNERNERNERMPIIKWEVFLKRPPP